MSSRRLLDSDALNLEARINKRKLITDATPQSETGGYWCDVCLCSLRDSNVYLDHINGTNHQRKLGFSMRVEKSTVSSVRDRLKALKEKKEGGGKIPTFSSSGMEHPPYAYCSQTQLRD